MDMKRHSHSTLPASRVDGRARAVVEGVRPAVECGRFPVKRVTGEEVIVEADAYTDGHDALICVVRHRHESVTAWSESPMAALGNDRWRGAFTVERPGTYRYTVVAWVDRFASWRRDFSRRVDDADIAIAARTGAALAADTAKRAPAADARRLRAWAKKLEEKSDAAALKRLALDDDLAALAAKYPDRGHEVSHEPELAVTVDRERARHSSWYEMFPRSASADPRRHGTFRDCELRLPYVAGMGFDVLYLPPIHPIGRIRRKGRNNTLDPAAEDVGSPWAIGSSEGGHKAVHPALGTLEDFRSLVQRAAGMGIEVALDIAFQCAPDHPYVKEHPEWFSWRPDGTVQYAENPPKKYQDIYPFNFETEAWRELWEELKSIFEFWIAQGVTIFRVDNPHTKPFAFWEWAITSLKAAHPDLIFLSEAFTRPKIMHRLAKAGFTQSYTYFTWRNTKQELTEYFTELSQGEGREYFRPNVWPNTPDILHERLQHGGRPVFCSRLLLAATLSANYGIYGPAYELLEAAPREAGSEEYLDSEKYEIRHWNLERPDSLRDLISRVNEIRRDNPVLQSDWSLAFEDIDNDELIAYRKSTPDAAAAIVTVVNLDPYHVQSGWLRLDLAALNLEGEGAYQMHDLLTGSRYLWQGERNFIRLQPGMAHIFRVRRRVRSEQESDYFL
jgi:starch synthase (maltosyl-transferring)